MGGGNNSGGDRRSIPLLIAAIAGLLYGAVMIYRVLSGDITATDEAGNVVSRLAMWQSGMGKMIISHVVLAVLAALLNLVIWHSSASGSELMVVFMYVVAALLYTPNQFYLAVPAVLCIFARIYVPKGGGERRSRDAYKRSTTLLIAAILGVVYAAIMIIGVSMTNTFSVGTESGAVAATLRIAESEIGRALIWHIALATIAALVSVLGWATNARWIALCAALLYVASALIAAILLSFIVFPYWQNVVVQMALCFVAFLNMTRADSAAIWAD